MAGEWRETTLGEFVSFQSGGTPSKGNAAYWGGAIPWVSAKDMKQLFLDDSEDHVTETAIKDGAKIVPPGTVLMLARGMTLHNDVPICIVRRALTFNQDVKALHTKSGLDGAYLPYLLLGHKPRLLSMVDSAGHGTGRFNTDELKRLDVLLPPLREQQAIACVLGALDDKIELNRRRNATLEAVARALFRSWFVDFDPVRAKAEGRAPVGMSAAVAALFPAALEDSALGPIPKGWRVGTVGELADIMGGSTPSTKEARYWEGGTHAWATPKDLSNLAVPVLLSTERCVTADGLEAISSGLLPVGTVLLSSRAPIGYLAINRVPVAINQGFIAMKPRGGASPHFLLRWAEASQEAIVSRANGSTFLEISKSNFRPIPLVVPDDAIHAALLC